MLAAAGSEFRSPLPSARQAEFAVRTHAAAQGLMFVEHNTTQKVVRPNMKYLV
jgi:hypothetical protein